jgi:AmmeMemoRadiSam system protein B
MSLSYPRLRPIEIRTVNTAAQGPGYMLRDPLRLAESYLIVPEAFAPLLMLLDGTNELGDLHALLSAQLGAVSGPSLLDQLLAALDEALLLDNARFRAARAAVSDAYARAACRAPSMAGLSYPATAGELRSMFDDLLERAGDVELSPADSRALLSPHIDYERGGHVYAQVWKSAAAALREAELVVVLATDHYSPEAVTLTRQHYATPYGTLPTERSVVDALAEACGPSDAFAAELYHRHEHSIELVVTWLHHMRGGQPCPVVPILCGSFQRFVRGRELPETDRRLAGLLAALREVMAQRRVAIVISGDLSHVGPAFGGAALEASSEEALRSDDQALLAHMRAGSAEGFWGEVRAQRDRNNVCGVPPLYLALRLLGQTSGELIDYARCPADDDDTSAVTIAGMVFR